MAKYINVGYGAMMPDDVVLAVVPPNSAPVKRKIEQAKLKKEVIDLTFGRRTRSVIFTKSGNIILTAVNPETIIKRFNES